MALYFFGQSLADVPVGDIVLEKMRSDDEGNGEVRIGNFRGNEGTGGGVSDREHSGKYLVYSIK